jgi:hypothetical protein
MSTIDHEREALAAQYVWAHGDSQTRADFLAGYDAGFRRKGPIIDEWEYGCQSGAHMMAVRDRRAVVLADDHHAAEHGHDCPSPAIVRRRKAGPWEPVETAEAES